MLSLRHPFRGVLRTYRATRMVCQGALRTSVTTSYSARRASVTQGGSASVTLASSAHLILIGYSTSLGSLLTIRLLAPDIGSLFQSLVTHPL